VSGWALAGIPHRNPTKTIAEICWNHLPVRDTRTLCQLAQHLVKRSNFKRIHGQIPGRNRRFSSLPQKNLKVLFGFWLYPQWCLNLILFQPGVIKPGWWLSMFVLHISHVQNCNFPSQTCLEPSKSDGPPYWMDWKSWFFRKHCHVFSFHLRLPGVFQQGQSHYYGTLRSCHAPVALWQRPRLQWQGFGSRRHSYLQGGSTRTDIFQWYD